MAQAPPWKQLIDIGRQITEDQNSQTHRFASELVAQGQHTANELSARVGELLAQTRRRGNDLGAEGRAAVARQLDVLDLATKGVLAAVAYRLFGGRDPRAIT